MSFYFSSFLYAPEVSVIFYGDSMFGSIHADEPSKGFQSVASLKDKLFSMRSIFTRRYQSCSVSGQKYSDETI